MAQLIIPPTLGTSGNGFQERANEHSTAPQRLLAVARETTQTRVFVGRRESNCPPSVLDAYPLAPSPTNGLSTKSQNKTPPRLGASLGSRNLVGLSGLWPMRSGQCLAVAQTMESPSGLQKPPSEPLARPGILCASSSPPSLPLRKSARGQPVAWSRRRAPGTPRPVAPRTRRRSPRGRAGRPGTRDQMPNSWECRGRLELT